MSRVGRLLAPSAGAFVIAAVGLVLAPMDRFTLRGGLSTAALVILFGEILVTVLSLVLVRNDALPPSFLFRVHGIAGQLFRVGDLARRHHSAAGAWLAVTLGVDVAALLTSAAVAVPVVFLVEAADPTIGGQYFPLGGTDVGLRSSEVVVIVALVIICIAGAAFNARGLRGLVAGLCLGTLATHVRLGPPRNERWPTAIGWSVTLVVVVVVASLLLWSRRFTAHHRLGVHRRAQPV